MPAPNPSKRFLTKSNFKLASECPTKLFYADNPEYANQSISDDFLRTLADGGILVGELAKEYFPGGHTIETLDYDKSISQTKELLNLDQVTIF